MILDSSAVIAILLREKRHDDLEEVLASASAVAIGAPTLLETSMVATRLVDRRGGDLLARFLEGWEVEVVPFGKRHWRVAADAFARYGKGRHPAALNYGDCMTYASARLAEMPLLFVGDDFLKTDIVPAG